MKDSTIDLLQFFINLIQISCLIITVGLIIGSLYYNDMDLSSMATMFAVSGASAGFVDLKQLKKVDKK